MAGATAPVFRTFPIHHVGDSLGDLRQLVVGFILREFLIRHRLVEALCGFCDEGINHRLRVVSGQVGDGLAVAQRFTQLGGFHVEEVGDRLQVGTAPVTRPVAPTRAMTSPCFTTCPCFTNILCRCKKLDEIPCPWSRIKVPPEKIRVIMPDVGGGFGAKNFVYPENVMVMLAATFVLRANNNKVMLWEAVGLP